MTQTARQVASGFWQSHSISVACGPDALACREKYVGDDADPVERLYPLPDALGSRTGLLQTLPTLDLPSRSFDYEPYGKPSSPDGLGVG